MDDNEEAIDGDEGIAVAVAANVLMFLTVPSG
jgi:hypothetical protein